MSLAEKFEVIADEVYKKGYSKAELEFWSNYPSGSNIQYAFAYQCFDDSNYKPIQDITLTKYMYYSSLYYNSPITDTKVTIDVSASTVEATNVFRTSKLKTIRKVIVSENNTFSYWFRDCSALENITFEGVIGNNIDFSDSPLLKVESMVGTVATEEQIAKGVNILEFNGVHYYGGIFIALKNIAGTGTTRTCTLGSTNLTKLTDEQKAIATEKGWTLA